jgi:hypothetical protein
MTLAPGSAADSQVVEMTVAVVEMTCAGLCIVGELRPQWRT